MYDSNNVTFNINMWKEMLNCYTMIKNVLSVVHVYSLICMNGIRYFYASFWIRSFYNFQFASSLYFVLQVFWFASIWERKRPKLGNAARYFLFHIWSLVFFSTFFFSFLCSAKLFSLFISTLWFGMATPQRIASFHR